MRLSLSGEEKEKNLADKKSPNFCTVDCSPLGLESDDLTSVSTKLGLSENLKKSCRTYGTEIVFIDWHSE